LNTDLHINKVTLYKARQKSSTKEKNTYKGARSRIIPTWELESSKVQPARMERPHQISRVSQETLEGNI